MIKLKIVPVQFNLTECDMVSIEIGVYQLNKGAMVSTEFGKEDVRTVDGETVIGFIPAGHKDFNLSTAEFNLWGNSDAYIADLAVQKFGLTPITV